MISLLAYLLLEGFNPNPLCTDTERNKTHKERQNIHIFVNVLGLKQSDIVSVMFSNLNSLCANLLSTLKHYLVCLHESM